MEKKHTLPNKKLDNSKSYFEALIRKVAEKINSTQSQKYGHAPDAIKEKGAESEKFRDIYNFYRLVKVKEHAERYECTDVKKDKNLRGKLREPLKIREKVLAFARFSRQELYAINDQFD